MEEARVPVPRPCSGCHVPPCDTDNRRLTNKMGSDLQESLRTGPMEGTSAQLAHDCSQNDGSLVSVEVALLLAVLERVRQGNVRAHSTRGMAASKALAAGSTPQKVCDAAGWSTPHTFVKFYAVNLDLTPFSQRDRKGTEEKRMKMEESALLTLVSSVDQPSSAVEVFIPELVEKCAEDETKDEYRFLCPRAGQFMCKVTKLMFEMEGEGEVLYRIVSWDSCPLDGLGQKEPAGPLYSINCQKGSIRKLHLPHCETRKDDGKLTVAHVTGGNVEIIQPLQVTDTHVIIAVHNLSRFGLLMIFGDYPIKAQVLVFDMNLKGKHRKNKLHMHLLPGNVPAEEVKKQECNMSMSASCQPNIASRATCDLTPGKEYRPVSKNTHHEITIQPEVRDRTYQYTKISASVCP
ncbi:uncharacterized protein Hap1MRO34_025713 [Clarias gariepinus]